jgi:hypothetical protein
MRLALSRFGGLLGAAGPTVTIDTDSVDPQVASRLRNLLDRAAFFDLPDEIASPRAKPDEFGYELTVTDGERFKSVSFDYDSAPEPLRQLANAVRAAARKA